MKIKRTVSAVLSLAMTLSCLSFGAGASASSADAEARYGEEINLIKAFGIMTGDENGNFNPSNALTRAEFAKVLSKVLRLKTEDDTSVSGTAEDEWFKKYLGDIDFGQIIQEKPTIREDVFPDVAGTHWASGVIEAVCGTGYMKGFSDGMFYPDKTIKLQEAVKTMVCVLGYEPRATQRGGYPAGYMSVAEEIEMLDGIDASADDDIKRDELAKLIANCLEIDVVQLGYTNEGQVYQYSEEKKSLLNEVMEMDCIEGVITDNGITAQDGESTVPRGKIKIGGEVFRLADEAGYIRQYISRRVKLYVTDYDDGDDVALYAVVKDKSFESFPAEDLIEISNSSVKYINDKDRERTAKTVNMPYIIYNGKAVSRITDDMLKERPGVITLTASNSGNFDTVSIEMYDSWFISGINTEDKKLYNAIKYEDESIELDLDTSEDKLVDIYDTDMNRLDFSDLTENTVVDVYGDDDYAKIIVCGKVMKDAAVDAVSEDEYKEITVDGEVYRLTHKLNKSAQTPDVKNGKVYTLYFNSFGDVAYVEENAAVNGTVAYLIKLYEDDWGESTVMKLATFYGAIVTYSAAEKVRVEYADGEKKNIDGSRLSEVLGSYSGVLEYRTNDEEKISAVTIPLSAGTKEKSENRLRIVCENTEIKYLKAQSCFNAKTIIDTKTKLLQINEKATSDEEKFRTIQKTALTETTYNIQAFNSDPDSVKADYVVITSDLTGDYTKTPIEMLIVTDRAQVLDADDEPAIKLSGYYLSTTSVPVYKEISSNSGAFDNAAYVGDIQNKSGAVKPGDIIRYYENNGNVETAVICYSSTQKYDGATRKGAIPGVASYWAAELKGQTNPITFSNALKLTLSTTGANSFSTGEFRLVDANAYSLDGDILTYTTQPLTDIAANGCTDENSKYVVESITLPVFTVMTLDGKRVEVKAGSKSDIRTYKNYGSECSRVFAHIRSGRIEKVIIINGELK